MTIKGWILLLVLVSASLTAVFSCFCSSDANGRISSLPAVGSLPDTALLMEGDVVMRAGKGIISTMLQKMSLRDRSFSHAGILMDSSGQWMVVHMLGGEGSVRPELRIEPLDVFCSSLNSDSNAVFRLTGSESIRSGIVKECKRLMQEPPRFDSRFDLGTDDALYCTEMVYKVFLKASRGEISLPLTEFAGERYAACDDLYLNDYAQLIRSH